MTEALPLLTLTPHGTHRVLDGHPWIFRTELAAGERPEDGALVDVRDARGRFVVRGYYNGRSHIAVRALAREPVPIEPAFWRARLDAALQYRAARCPARAACRLIHGEADGLPGLMVDRYDDTLVLHVTTLGMRRFREGWVDLLRERLQPRVIVARSDPDAARREGFADAVQTLYGAVASEPATRIGGVLLAYDVGDTHKTGGYLDQQENYEQVARFTRPGMRVLDAFCHTAGFALHALAAGAASAVALDSSAVSLAGARRSAALNGLADRLTATQGNAFDVLRAYQRARAVFELIVLDPPSFTRGRQAVAEAARGYKEIHVRALKLLAPGGLLATFCCSHHVSAATFLDIVRDAAADTRAALRRELILGAAPDHPVLLHVPETEYLKGFLFTRL